MINKNLANREQGGQEGRLFNEISLSENLQVQQSDKNLSTIQPLNLSTKNNLPSYLPTFLSSKKAFTLSEVLITLGIIGVVAAMTLPTVIKNYQKQVTVNKLKKVYTILNQATTLSQAENGEYKNFDDASVIGINQYFDKYWKPYLKILKICNTYKECGYSSNTPWFSGNNVQAGTVIISKDKRLPVILQDGSLILFNNTSSAFFVDLNAGLLPNMLGKDVFQFERSQDGRTYPYGYNKTLADIKLYCSANARIYCATKIMNDGWKIEKDYPW